MKSSNLPSFLEETQAGPDHPAPYLASPTGERQEIPSDVFQILRYIVDAFSQGQGVTVMPTNAQLTTQQAADHLGMSRPTLVKLLESGEIPFTKVGRHRRLTLEDLMTYEKVANEARILALDELTEDAVADGTYFVRLRTTKTR